MLELKVDDNDEKVHEVIKETEERKVYWRELNPKSVNSFKKNSME